MTDAAGIFASAGAATLVTFLAAGSVWPVRVAGPVFRRRAGLSG